MREFFDRMPAMLNSPRDRFGLTLAQKMAYPVLKWFFFGDRASGRSTLMAHVLIREAIERNRPVQLIDHTEVDCHLQSRQVMMHFVTTVDRVFHQHYADKFEFRIEQRNGFQLTAWPRSCSYSWNGEWL